MNLEQLFAALAELERAKGLLGQGGAFKACVERNADQTWRVTVGASVYDGNTLGEALQAAFAASKQSVRAARDTVKGALEQVRNILGGET